MRSFFPLLRIRKIPSPSSSSFSTLPPFFPLFAAAAARVAAATYSAEDVRHCVVRSRSSASKEGETEEGDDGDGEEKKEVSVLRGKRSRACLGQWRMRSVTELGV